MWDVVAGMRLLLGAGSGPLPTVRLTVRRPSFVRALRLGQSVHDQLVGVAHQLIDDLPRHCVTSRTRSARALLSPESKAVAVALDKGVDEPGGPEPIREARRIDRLEHVADVQSAARRGVLPIGADKQTARSQDPGDLGKGPILHL